MTKELFLAELKNQYDKEFELRTSLDTKSSNLVAISGIVISLLFGFGLLLIQKIEVNYGFFVPMKVLLVIIIIMNLCSILFAIWSSKIRKYRYAFVYKKFFDVNGDRIDSEVNRYANASQEEFNSMLVHEYLDCNRQNFDTNEKKALYIKIGQYLLMAALGLLPILTGLLLAYPPKFLGVIN